MERLKRQLKFQIRDSKKSLIVFWLILLSVNILGYFINFYNSPHMRIGVMNNTREISVTGANMVAIVIFIIVYSMVMYYESFPLSIGFSSTRRNFYKGALAHNVLLCFSMAVIEGVLLKMDRFVIESIGLTPLNDFGVLKLQSDGLFTIIFVLFLNFLIFAAIFNLLGILVYRFTYLVWFVIAGVFLILGNLESIRIHFEGIYRTMFVNGSILQVFLQTLVMAAILYLAGWAIVRKMDVRSGK